MCAFVRHEETMNDTNCSACVSGDVAQVHSVVGYIVVFTALHGMPALTTRKLSYTVVKLVICAKTRVGLIYIADIYY